MDAGHTWLYRSVQRLIAVREVTGVVTKPTSPPLCVAVCVGGGDNWCQDTADLPNILYLGQSDNIANNTGHFCSRRSTVHIIRFVDVHTMNILRRPEVYPLPKEV